MHLYRYDFLNLAGVATGHHSIQLPTDGAAINVGHHMLSVRHQDCAVLEIWQLNRLVRRVVPQREALQGFSGTRLRGTD